MLKSLSRMGFEDVWHLLKGLCLRDGILLALLSLRRAFAGTCLENTSSITNVWNTRAFAKLFVRFGPNCFSVFA